MSKKSFWVLVLFIFCILFRPPIIPIDLIYPLTAISIYGIFRELRNRSPSATKFYLAKPVSDLVRWSILIVLMAGLGITMGVVAGTDYSLSSTLNATAKIAWTIWLLPINIVYLFMIFQRKNVDVDTILRMILYATLIQATIAIVSYLVPDIKSIFISIMQANNWSERWTSIGAADQRMNGFAKSLFDTFGYGMGILASVPFILAYRKRNLKYLLTLPLIFMAIFINARTGLLILGIVAALFSLLLMRRYRLFVNKRSTVIVVGVALMIAPLVMYAFSSFMASDTSFSEHTENDINSYVEFIRSGGQNVGSYGGQADVLFSANFWTLPGNLLQLFFGAGMSVYGGDTPFAFSSDVGYVNNIWYFGIIGTVLFHVTLLFYLWAVTRHSPYWRTFSTIAIISMLVFQVKGNAFWSANLGITATFLLATLSVYSWHKELAKATMKVRS